MVEGVGEFWGLTAHGWIAVGTLALAVATFALVLTAFIQIRSIREENKKTQTLAACSNYDLNPIIFECTRILLAAQDSGELATSPKKYRPQILTLLNYLDAIAIGIEQGLYIEELAWDHLETIVRWHVASLVDSGVMQGAGLERDDFRRLLDMRVRWSRARPRFREHRGFRFWRRKE
jgi:hypothetical protein